MQGIPTSSGGPQLGGGILNQIGCLLFGFVFLFFGFYLLKYLLIGLYALSPLIFIAALATNYKVVAGLLRQHFALFRYDPWRFLVRTFLALLFFPFVSLFLLVLASGMGKAEKFAEQIRQQMVQHPGQHPGDDPFQGGGQQDDPFSGGGNFRTRNEKAEKEDFTDFEELDSKPLHTPKPPPEKQKPENPYEDILG